MLFRSHFILGAASTLVISSSFEEMILMMPIGALASMFPDLDHAGSKISKATWPFSLIISKSFSHRGFTHSFLFASIVSGSFCLLFSRTIYLPIATGILSHIFSDMLTARGCQVLYPKNKLYRFCSLKTGNNYEGFIVILICIFLAFARMALQSCYY